MAFVSYISVEPPFSDAEGDTGVHQGNLEIESRAIDYITRLEPSLTRMPRNNAGYDLAHSAQGTMLKAVEVKSISGPWTRQPVALSRAQFEFAVRFRERYWLYVVENVGSENPRLFRIQDPAGRGSYFTFDHGWAAADVSRNGAASEQTIESP